MTQIRPGWLDRVERIGNRLPDPSTLFLIGTLLVMLLSQLAVALDWEVTRTPQREGATVTETVTAVGLLDSDGVWWLLSNLVESFVGFPPLGLVLVGLLGIGVAERSGLLPAVLRRLLAMAPARLLVPATVLAGILSSIALDAGYVVLPPLAAGLFLAAGRSPLAGIAAVTAGVTCGFSANLLITGLDPLLAGLSTVGARLLDPDYQVAISANWWFMMGETMRTMGPYLVLAFFAAQFIACFARSRLGEMLAVVGGSWLASLDLPGAGLAVAFILVVMAGNLVVGSASAKYALFAPVFVPMFKQAGISPELTQAGYRVGDSVTNGITPFNPYLIIILAFVITPSVTSFVSPISVIASRYHGTHWGIYAMIAALEHPRQPCPDATMDLLLDLLRFRVFISPIALMVFYYLGAVVMPVAAWLLLLQLRRRWPLLGHAIDEGKRAAISVTRRRDRLLFLAVFVACFLFMELMWRMLFEFLIAFLQMREALLQLQEGAIT